jgi:hypothetical protein
MTKNISDSTYERALLQAATVTLECVVSVAVNPFAPTKPNPLVQGGTVTIAPLKPGTKGADEEDE